MCVINVTTSGFSEKILRIPSGDWPEAVITANGIRIRNDVRCFMAYLMSLLINVMSGYWGPRRKPIGKRSEMLNVTYYLTGVYFLTMNLKVLNTSRTGQGGDSIRGLAGQNRVSLVAL
jgi:hypothetical protein